MVVNQFHIRATVTVPAADFRAGERVVDDVFAVAASDGEVALADIVSLIQHRVDRLSIEVAVQLAGETEAHAQKAVVRVCRRAVETGAFADFRLGATVPEPVVEPVVETETDWDECIVDEMAEAPVA